MILASFLGGSPGARHPGRIVPYVLLMTAFQIGDPVALVIAME
jgi:hypothetical protein